MTQEARAYLKLCLLSSYAFTTHLPRRRMSEPRGEFRRRCQKARGSRGYPPGEGGVRGRVRVAPSPGGAWGGAPAIAGNFKCKKQNFGFHRNDASSARGQMFHVKHLNRSEAFWGAAPDPARGGGSRPLPWTHPAPGAYAPWNPASTPRRRELACAQTLGNATDSITFHEQEKEYPRGRFRFVSRETSICNFPLKNRGWRWLKRC